MKTTNLIYAIAVLMGVFFISCSQSGTKENTQAPTENKTVEINEVKINPANSRVTWAGDALGMYTHTGVIRLDQADLSIKEGKITGGSFTVDMTSIVTTDDNYKPEEGSSKEKLIGHLSSSDFFDVGNFPTSKFKITSVEGNMAVGQLTIRGITNEEKVENITILKDNDKIKISGDLIFDRKKYDVIWDYPMKDMILSNDVKIKIDLIGS